MGSYTKRREKKCTKVLEDFEPDFSGCRYLDTAYKILELTRQGLTSFQIGEIVGKTPKAIQKFWRRYNFPCFHNIEVKIREEQPMWKGGIKIVKGYYYKRSPDHPNHSIQGCYVAVHRLVMEEKLGRYLLRTEVVDHIDGNPGNNNPENLRLFASNGEHLRETLMGRPKNISEAGRKKLSDKMKEYWRLKKAQTTSSNR